jgi:hypothetical protein
VRPPRRLLTASLGVAAAIVAVASPALARSARPKAYYVTLSVRGSFSYRFLGMAVAGFDQLDTANWTYKDRFGPIDVSGSGTHSARAATPKVSGGWSNSLTFEPQSASSDCQVLGHFVPNGGGRLRVTELHAPGFDGAVLAISGGSAPLAALPDQTCGDSHDLFFAGPPPRSEPGACTGIREDFKGSSQQAGGCSTATFFTARVSVSPEGLRARHGSYRVSDTKPAGEKVATGCNEKATAGVSWTCAYSWSGTVTLAPAP